MTDSLPAPLAPSDCDVRDVGVFMLNVDEMTVSEFAATATGDEYKAAVMIRCRAWKQVPAGSVPDDDKTLAAFAGLSTQKWKRVRAKALFGFVKCSDGRLYHEGLVADALRARANKAKAAEQRKTNAKRLREWREEKRRNGARNDAETRFTREGETETETRFVRSLPVPVPEDSSPSTSIPASPRAALMAKVWKALGVADATGVPPTLVGDLSDLAERLLAEGCDFEAHIGPALRCRPPGQAWPRSVAYWRAIALVNRDKRIPASAVPSAPVEIGEQRDRYRVWREHGKWKPAWGPRPDEPGCLLSAEAMSEAAA